MFVLKRANGRCIFRQIRILKIDSEYVIVAALVIILTFPVHQVAFASGKDVHVMKIYIHATDHSYPTHHALVVAAHDALSLIVNLHC